MTEDSKGRKEVKRYEESYGHDSGTARYPEGSFHTKSQILKNPTHYGGIRYEKGNINHLYDRMLGLARERPVCFS
jgi:hypothetical protein